MTRPKHPLPPAPHAPSAPSAPAGPPPDQIVGAWQSWLATCVLQVAAAMTTLAINLLNPAALLDIAAQGPGGLSGPFGELGPEEKILVARSSAVLTMVLTLAAAAAFAFLAFRMRAGAKWARLLLVAGTAYPLVKALVMVFGGPSGPWALAPAPLQLADGALTIASACAACAALALASGRAALEYFGSVGKRPGGDGRKDGENDGGRHGG